jgi:hypothetical protein
MIEKRHDVGLKPEHACITGFASIGLSFLARATSLKTDKAETGRADRRGSSSATGDPRSPARAPRCAVFEKPCRPTGRRPGSLHPAASPDRRPARRSVTEHSRIGAA